MLHAPPQPARGAALVTIEAYVNTQIEEGSISTTYLICLHFNVCAVGEGLRRFELIGLVTDTLTLLSMLINLIRISIKGVSIELTNSRFTVVTSKHQILLLEYFTD